MQTNIFNQLYAYGVLTYDIAGIEGQLPSVAVSIANMTAINQAGGVKVWSLPHPLTDDDMVHYHNTGSPIVFKSSCLRFAVGDWSIIPSDAVTFSFDLSGVTYQAYIDTAATGTVELPLYMETGAVPEAVLKADELNGVATFDVATLVSTWYEPLPQFNILPGIWEAIDTSLRFRTYGLQEAGQFSTYLCVRGVSVAGATNSGTSVITDIELLTQSRRFVRAGALTLRVTVVFGEELLFSGDNFSYTFLRGHVYHLGTQYWDWLNEQDGMTELLEDLGLIMCEPLLPVVWLNQHGGLESYVFRRLQTYERSAKTSGARINYNDYTRTDVSISDPYGLEYRKSVTFGAENLSDKELALLQELPISPCVTTPISYGVYERLAVSEYKNKEFSASNLHEFEATFDIPVTVLDF